jgi:hypothetical protein
VHDYFDILGVSRGAPASDIRRACGRHSRPPHPDIWDGDVRRSTGASHVPARDGGWALSDSADAAIDFVDASTLVDRIREAFFIDSHPQACASTSTR